MNTGRNRKCNYLSDWYDVRNRIEQELVSICDTKMSEGKADDVENEMEEIIDGKGAHQKMEIPHNLKSRKCHQNVMSNLSFYFQWKRQK